MLGHWFGPERELKRHYRGRSNLLSIRFGRKKPESRKCLSDCRGKEIVRRLEHLDRSHVHAAGRIDDELDEHSAVDTGGPERLGVPGRHWLLAQPHREVGAS